MTQPAKSQEPSMEEILASIRRIIADDDATKSTPPAAEPASVAAAPEPPAESEAPVDAAHPSDILELTESMAAPMPEPSVMPEPTPQFRTIDGKSDVDFDDAAEPPAAPFGRLISGATSAAVDSAFSALAQTVLVQNARTLEDLVREMLRPMLKSWLDDNLPGLVERIVKAEIERVSRGR
jgi:cell pole-organizing protein PopZ